jgi:hypothetical protein
MEEQGKRPQELPAQKAVFARRRDILIVVALLLVAAILYFVFTFGRGQGGVACVTVLQADGEQVVTEVDLSKDQIIHIDGAALPVTLEVLEGRIRFIHSQCPDHICENTGWLQYEGDEAICLPAGVWVRVERIQLEQ